jgi:hypothetical protein
MFDFVFQKFFEKNLTILKFFYLIQINFFLCFCNLFFKTFWHCVWLQRQVQEILNFNFFSLLQNNNFFYIFKNIFLKKISRFCLVE